MANPIKWQSQGYDARGTVLTTEMNSLADATRTVASSVIDNSSNLDQYGVFELVVTFPIAPGTGAYVAVYMVTAPDGTNYEDGSDSVDPGVHNNVVFIPVRAITTQQRLTSPIFALKPAKTKFIVFNKGTTAMGSSGNVLKLFTANDQVN